jgi:hypothetical protein
VLLEPEEAKAVELGVKTVGDVIEDATPEAGMLLMLGRGLFQLELSLPLGRGNIPELKVLFLIM